MQFHMKYYIKAPKSTHFLEMKFRMHFFSGELVKVINVCFQGGGLETLVSCNVQYVMHTTAPQRRPQLNH